MTEGRIAELANARARRQEAENRAAEIGRLKRVNEQMRAALYFYTRPEAYRRTAGGSPIMQDKGQIARGAIAAVEQQETSHE